MKRLALVVGMLVLANSAMAQSNEHVLRVTSEELTTISKGLGSLPYNEVALLFNKLQQQIQAQQEAAKRVAQPEVKTDTTEPKK